MSLRIPLAMLALVLLVACEPPATEPVKDPGYPAAADAPFPPPDPASARKPASGTCLSDIDCRGNGTMCLSEGAGKPGTCVRMDPPVGPSGVPSGPCVGGHC